MGDLVLLIKYPLGVTNMQENQRFIINDKGKKTSIILPIDTYEELIEDIHDLAMIAERKDESSINFDDLKAKLKTDGFI
jgi:hypothetical protein